jgi:hypothetical protein
MADSLEDHAVSAEDDAHLNAIIASGNVLLIAGEGGFSCRSSDGVKPGKT